MTIMSDPLPELYNVVGIEADGRRVIIETGFPLHDAELCRDILEKHRVYQKIVVERANEFDPPDAP